MKERSKNKKVIYIFICIIIIIAISVIIIFKNFINNKNDYNLNPKNPQNIVIWHYYNGTQAVAFENLINEFNNTIGLEKGIIVSAESKSSIEDLIQEILNSANHVVGAEDMPNIFQSYLDTVVQIDNMDLLVNLDEYISEDIKKEYIDSYIDEGIIGENNEWKLFPIAKSTEVLALNKTDWDKFSKDTGIKTQVLSTWEGITKTAEEYYNWSNGKSFFGRDAFANYIIIACKQLGEELFQVDNGIATVNIDEEIMKKLWDNFYVPYIKGYFKHIGRYRSDDVKIGEIICCACSTSGMLYFPKEVTIEDNNPYSIETSIYPIPNFEGTKSCAVQQGASMAVTKSTPIEEYASIIFLEWFTNEERNIDFAVNSGYLPVKKEANNYEKIENYLTDNEMEATNLQKDTLKVAIEQVKDYELYTTKGFKGGEEARTVLGISMLQKAQDDREQILSEIESGISQKDAIKPYLTEKYFKEWLADLKQQLEIICQ